LITVKNGKQDLICRLRKKASSDGEMERSDEGDAGKHGRDEVMGGVCR
jgi:hypothetical protein